MKSLSFNGSALSSGGRGDARRLGIAPIGVPGAMPQSRVIVQHADRGGSWMLPTILVARFLHWQIS